MASSSHQLFHMVWKHTSVPSLSKMTALGSNIEGGRLVSEMDGEKSDMEEVGNERGEKTC